MNNFKTDIKFHRELQACANAVYGKKDYSIPERYEIIEKKGHPSGFNALVLKKGNNIVIAYGGTHGVQDLYADARLLSGVKPLQFEHALNLYIEYKENDKYKDCKFYTTGDSLGGGMSQYVGAVSGVPSVTFNAQGVGHLVRKEKIEPHSNNIINYVNKLDTWVSHNSDNIIGKCYELETLESKKKSSIFVGNDHFFTNQKPVTHQKEIKKEDLEYWEEGEELKELSNRVSNQINTEVKEIKNNINNSFYQYIQESINRSPKFMIQMLNNYLDTFEKPDKSYNGSNNTKYFTANLSHNGQIYIKEYRRMDGTRVEGHWRSLPDDAGFDPNKKLTDMDKDELDKALDFYMDVYK